jgi:hypothetical protein
MSIDSTKMRNKYGWKMEFMYMVAAADNGHFHAKGYHIIEKINSSLPFGKDILASRMITVSRPATECAPPPLVWQPDMNHTVAPRR